MNCPATELVEPSVPFLAKSLFFAACIANKRASEMIRPLKTYLYIAIDTFLHTRQSPVWPRMPGPYDTKKQARSDNTSGLLFSMEPVTEIEPATWLTIFASFRPMNAPRPLLLSTPDVNQIAN